jgi:hypothetical protein
MTRSSVPTDGFTTSGGGGSTGSPQNGGSYQLPAAVTSLRIDGDAVAVDVTAQEKGGRDQRNRATARQGHDYKGRNRFVGHADGQMPVGIPLR